MSDLKGKLLWKCRIKDDNNVVAVGEGETPMQAFGQAFSLDMKSSLPVKTGGFLRQPADVGIRSINQIGESQVIPFPNKKYSIIYADPPWKYKDTASAGKRGAVFKYPVMDLEEIKALPVKEISADNSILFMWVTLPFLDSFLEVVNAWGFTYKTVAFIWVKKYFGTDKLFLGMGRWTRSNAEICILATKGRPKRINAGIRQVIISDIREHSQKPAEARKRIVELIGELPRIELFAREDVEGWDVWGNEVPHSSQGLNPTYPAGEIMTEIPPLEKKTIKELKIMSERKKRGSWPPSPKAEVRLQELKDSVAFERSEWVSLESIQARDKALADRLFCKAQVAPGKTILCSEVQGFGGNCQCENCKVFKELRGELK